uniref:Lipid droplet-associated hydrolase n=1 Tax=Haemonchus contortus TaxID=6289 RepID=A0A7I5EDM6_HAECO
MLREISRRVDWVLVGGRWTRMSVIGTSLSADVLDRENKGDVDDRVVILMIPGNPGNEGFYADFGHRVVKCLLSREERMGDRKRHYLFYTVSHLNHVVLPNELKNAGKPKPYDRFHLDAQVQHKLDFVREHLPKGQKVYILGHSIGAYMMLRILPYIKDDFNIRKVIGLFPTVEKMAASPNGVRLKRVLATLDANDWLAKSVSFWLDFLPEKVKQWLVSWNLTGEMVPSNVIMSAAELLNMNVFRNIVHMSHDELNKVDDFDNSLITNKELVYFYYGKEDGWCPEELGYSMETRLPRGHVQLDEHGCEHAFVIRDGAIVAEKLLQFIN